MPLFGFGKGPAEFRSAERDELRRMYDQMRGAQGFLDDIPIGVAGLFAARDLEYSKPLKRCVDELLASERFSQSIDLDRLDLKAEVEIRQKLRKCLLKGQNEGEVARSIILGIFDALAKDMPKTAEPSPFSVPFIYTMDKPREWITRLYQTLFDDRYRDADILDALHTQLMLNLCFHSGIEPYKPITRPLRHASESDLPLDKLNDTYLRGTPFHELFASPMPLRITLEERLTHSLVCGGPSAGKTSLIQNLILYDIKDEQRPSIVVIDPHSDLIQGLLKADLGVDDRIIYISPRQNPALNLFAVNESRMEHYDEHLREQVRASVIQTFNFLFSGLAGDTGALTSKQQILFTYCAELLLHFPEARGRNATIIDLLDLLTNPDAFTDVHPTLPPLTRNFFERDFRTQFKSTCEEVSYRLRGILANPAMARLLASPSTKVDLWHALNNGYIILVDTDKQLLKDGSGTFGRLFISLILQALMERAALPEKARRPTYLYVDEASDYFSDNIDDLLTEVRKFNCACLFAFQYLNQSPANLRSSLLGATGIKFGSQVSSSDAAALAREMRTTSDHILAQPKLQFAAHIRNVTPTAVSVPVKPGQVAAQPQRSQEALEALLKANRARVSLGDQAPIIALSPTKAAAPAKPPPKPAPPRTHQAAPAPPPPPPQQLDDETTDTY